MQNKFDFLTVDGEGPGMYEVRLLHSVYTEDGHFKGYQVHFNNEVKVLPTRIFRFRAESKRHATSLFLDISEVEYVKWVGPWPINNEF